MAKASIIFFPNVGKKNLKSGRVPIYMRIVLHSGKAESRLSIDVNENETYLWNPRMMRFEDSKMPVNKLLNKYEHEFEDIVYRYATQLNQLTASQLRDLLFGEKDNQRNTVLGYFNHYYENSVLPKATIAEGTKINYKKAINHFEHFLELTNRKNLLISEFIPAIAFEFKDYLLSNRTGHNKKGMLESSAAGNIKKLKSIIARGVDEEIFNRNPFASVKLKSQARYKEKLNSNEIKLLWQYNFEKFGTLDKVRDIFMFSVFTGLAYNDAIGIKSNQLQYWDNKGTFLNIKRTKTDVETKQFLVSQALQLIEKFKFFNTGKETLLPSISNQQLNMRLKIIAEKVGITKPLTSHIARHTFRQLLAESGIMDIAAIKSMMGHSRNRDIDAVYHNVTENQLLIAKNQFQSFLDALLIQ